MNFKGAMVISLDFELLWGVFDVVDFEKKRQYFSNTREVIPRILELFEQYEVNATWATVGMLFNKNWGEWNQNIPEIIPGYKDRDLSAYSFGRKIQKKNTESLCFAQDLIKKIHNTNGQEIGTHTYSHYYCQEPGQEILAFKEDLLMAIKLASENGIKLKSLVFPRNQIKESYLKICSDLGILNVRSNPESWYWKPASSNSFAYKVARTGDAYIAIGRKSYPKGGVFKENDLPIQQKASRLLRPVENRSILRDLKLKRIKKEMKLAAIKNEIYHLWWHPHNFGDNPAESLSDLVVILEYFIILRAEFGFQSYNMEEIGRKV